MSEAAQTTSSSLDLGRPAAGLESAVRRELVGWAWLAVGALAVAGLFAILLALSRIPGMENAPFWPLGFFYKGLVIHVVFSLVIWLMGIFAFLVSVATLKLSGEDMRAAPLGRIGQGAILVAFPCLFAPAFLNATQPELANYIPLIRHPAYDFGLITLALGVLAPVVRLLVNLPGRLAAAAAGYRDGARRLHLHPGVGVLRNCRDAARARGRSGVVARGAVLGRRTCAAVRLRRPHVDELVDPRALKPRREGGR